METLFITGAPGTDTLRLARILMEHKKLDYTIAYDGDDLVKSTYSPGLIIDNIKLDDPRFDAYAMLLSSSLGVKYDDFYVKHNRPCKLLICTSTISISEFYTGLMKYSDDPEIGLPRVIRYLACVDMNQIRYHEFDRSDKCYHLYKIVPHSIIYKYKLDSELEMEKLSETIAKICSNFGVLASPRDVLDNIENSDTPASPDVSSDSDN